MIYYWSAISSSTIQMRLNDLAVAEEVTWDSFGPEPLTLTCPVCKNRVVTITHSNCSWKTHLASTLMCCLCCPFCLIPYFVNVFKTVQHYCPACGLMLGEYRAW